MFKTPLLSFKIPFSTVYKQKNPIYGATKPFFGFLYFLKCCIEIIYRVYEIPQNASFMSLQRRVLQ